jgi:hypothetical protein
MYHTYGEVGRLTVKHWDAEKLNDTALLKEKVALSY